MATRFTETVDIRQSTDSQVFDNSLSSKLDAFANQQITEHSSNIARTSFEEGRAAFQGGKPEFKEEKFFGGIGSKAYNEGLRASYISSIDRDNRQEVSRLSAEHPENLAAFNDSVESYKRATLTNIDPSARQAISDSLESLISSNRIKVQNQEIKATHQANNLETSDHVQTAVNDALGFARDGNDIGSAESALAAFATIDGRVAADFISVEEGVIQKREIEKDITEESLRGGLFRTFDDEGVAAAYEKLDDLSDKVPGGFAPEEWDDFINRTQKDLNRKLARQERDLKGRAKQIKKEQDFAAIAKRREGDDTQIIDPKSADLYYQEVIVPEIEGAEPEVRRAAQAQYMDRLKIIPNTIMKEINNAANSNNPDLLSNAAQLVDRIDEIPGVINQIPTTEQAYLQNVSNLLANMDPAEAVELARRATDPTNKPRIEAAEARIKEIKKDSPGIYREKSAAAFSSFFAIDPLIDDVSRFQLAKEYGVVDENQIKAGMMNEADVWDKADKTIMRNWGETTALGVKRVMKYPMETYYSIDNDASWIKADLVTDVNENVAGPGVRAEDIILMSNDETARTATTGKPTYAVKILIDGSFVNIGQWAPDMAKEVERRKNQNVAEGLAERIKNIESNIGVEDLSDIGRAL